MPSLQWDVQNYQGDIMSNKIYNAYGKWHVTTEGDCEGRTTKDLGVHEGFLDDIAFALGGEAFYGLRFSTAKELPPPNKRFPVTSTHVSLDIDSDTWGMPSKARVEYFKKLLLGRKTIVRDSNFYASVVLVLNEVEAKEVIKRGALAKLTAEEQKALGF